MSIKKKFATAVATASLLAGIFGSAFVPGAAAATTPKAAYTELFPGGDMQWDHAANAFGFKSDNSYETEEDDDTSIEFALFETSEKCVDGDLTEDDCKSNTARYGADEYDPTSLSITSSNDDILVTLGINAAGNSDNCADLGNTVDARGKVTAGYFAASDSAAAAGANGDETADRVWYDASDDYEDYNLDTDNDDVQDTADTYIACFTAAEDDTAATSTITIKADGVTVASFKVIAVGPGDSMSLSITDGYKYVAGENEQVDGWLTLLVKDENGTVINGEYTSVSSVDAEDLFDGNGVDLYSDNPESPGEFTIDFFDDAEQGEDETLFDLMDGVCSTEEEDDMTGKSYSLKVEDGDSGDVVSNAISITCTENGDEARVTKVTPEALSGAKVYEEADGTNDLSLVATVVAGNGGSLGDGSGVACDEFDWDYASDYDELEEDISGTDDVLGGECELGFLEPGSVDDMPRFGKFTYVVTADAPDLGDSSADSVDFTLTYTATGTVDTVTIARTRNAAKTVATITFDGGEGAAFESVYFQVEKANGAVVEYRRRANGDGVARLVLARRNTTIYVYAFSETSDESDTIAVRFR